VPGGDQRHLRAGVHAHQVRPPPRQVHGVLPHVPR
jgi:hypothetical protein